MNASTKATSTVHQALANLRENKFVDQFTRAVLIDINLYNPTIDYVCTVRMVLEQTAGAGYIPSSRYHTTRLYVTCRSG